MKKILVIAIMIYAIVQSANSMIPGPPLLVSCPNCKTEKSLISIISGNTIGALQWSDLYQYAPMLPRLSPIQKCKECEGYYLLSKVERRYANEDEDVEHSGDTGRLTYKEMKEALVLLDDGFLTKEEEIGIRIEYLHRYNDAFRKFEGYYIEVSDDELMKREEEDLKLHKSNLTALTNLLDDSDDNDIILIAELYRESGDFEKCVALLTSFRPKEDYLRDFVRKIKKKAEEKKDKIFLIDDE